MEIRVLTLPYVKGSGAKFTYQRQPYNIVTMKREEAAQVYQLTETTYDNVFLGTARPTEAISEVPEEAKAERLVTFTGMSENYIESSWWTEVLQKYFPKFENFNVHCHHNIEALPENTAFNSPETLRIALFASNQSLLGKSFKCSRELYGIPVNCLDTMHALSNAEYSWWCERNTEVWGIIQNTLYILTDLTHCNDIPNWKENHKKIFEKIFQEATEAYKNITIDCKTRMEAATRKKLLEILNQRSEERKRELEVNKRATEESVNTHITYLNKAAADYSNACRELDSYNPAVVTEENLAETYKKIAKFGTIDATGNVLTVHYDRETVIKERYYHSGVYWVGTFNLGKFTAHIDLANFVVRFTNDELKNKYHLKHPHVNRDNQPCWGTGAREMVELLKSYNITEIVRQCFVFLSKYNDNSPFTHLCNYLEVCEERWPEGREEKRIVGDNAKNSSYEYPEE
jgi:hypothetical protein